MWFSPGILLAAIAAVIVYLVTGDTSQWWLWISLVIAAMVIDAILGVTPRRRVKAKRVTEYEKD